jgi:hypothetical protein
MGGADDDSKLPFSLLIVDNMQVARICEMKNHTRRAPEGRKTIAIDKISLFINIREVLSGIFQIKSN